MGSADEIDIVLLQELLYHGFTECVADASIIFTPTALRLLGVRPEKVAEKTIFGYFSWSGDLLELRNSHELRGEPSMHTKDLVVDQTCNW